jgi:hypothetical protein
MNDRITLLPTTAAHLSRKKEMAVTLQKKQTKNQKTKQPER